MDNDQLQEILTKHKAWAYGEEGGERASLIGANLGGAYLRGAYLVGANLRGAYLRGAYLEGASLRGAYLRGAYLEGASLIGANLIGTNLIGTNLIGTNLRFANLEGAKLEGANLGDAYLVGANLGDANLFHCSGNRGEIKSLFLSDEYPITYTSEHIQIGCEKHKISEWWEFDEDTIRNMDGNQAIEFWAKYKDFIKQAIELSPAKPTNYKED